MNLHTTEDILLTDCNATRSVAQMACYAVSLCLGSNLLCRALKTATVEKYLLAVSRYTKHLNPDNRDPRMDSPGDTKISPLVKSILNEQKRWESAPDRREPFLPELTRHLLNINKKINADPSCLLSALADWFIVGHYIGHRRSEAFQPPTHHSPHRPVLYDNGRPIAFLPEDLSFHQPHKRRTPLSTARSLSPNNLESATITWRYQKNGTKDEKKTLAHPKHPSARDLDGVTAFQNIAKRHHQLASHLPSPELIPLAVYKHNNGQIRLITSDDITAVMQRLAKEYYNITKDSELSKFTCHSIRVGAAVILHSMGFNPAQIKFLLRWNSDAYLTYLRNIMALSTQHADAINFNESNPQPDITL